MPNNVDGSAPLNSESDNHYGKVRGEERVAAKQRFYLALGLKKIEEEPSAKAYFDLGIQYQELGRHAEAASCFDRTFEMTKLPLALLYWAISEKHLRNYQTATGLLQRALKLGLDTFDVHLELGNLRLAENNLEQARDQYQECLKVSPKNPVAAFNQGLVHRKMSDPAGCRTLVQAGSQARSWFPPRRCRAGNAL
jgi:tetratricopeptide (TPR) repeat protein